MKDEHADEVSKYHEQEETSQEEGAVHPKVSRIRKIIASSMNCTKASVAEWSEGQRVAKDEVGEAGMSQITLRLRNHIRLYGLYPRDEGVIRNSVSLLELP